MDEIKELTDLKTKPTQLNLAVEKLKTLLSAGERLTIKQHLQPLQKKTANKANENRRKAEAFKIVKKEEISAIQEWNSSLDLKLDAAYVAVENLEKFLPKSLKCTRS